MDSNQSYLLKDRRFLPIFIVQSCGALNDSILKNALIILVTFKLALTVDTAPYILVMLANVLFITPFILFASLAGQIADRYERTILVKIIKFIEIIIALISAYGFYYNNLIILFSALTLMGIHSTFFGPIKYSVLPDQLKKNELMGANGYVEAATFIAILLGTIIGSFYNFSGIAIVVLILIVSLTGFVASFFMPESGNANENIVINPNIIAETVTILKYAYSKNQVYLAILGISWFWLLGAIIIAQIPLLTRKTFGADESVATLFLTVFSVGVGVGSFLCNKVFGNNITTKYVFISALCISIFGIDLFFAARIAEISYEPEQLKNVFQFFSKATYIRILIDLFLIAVFGGLYVVPLFAVMQYFTSAPYRSRVIAANNLVNAIFMAASAIILSLLLYVGFSIPSIILIISITNFVAALHIYKLIPNSKIVPLKLWRLVFRAIFELLYDIKIKGLENYSKAGKRSVVIANHLSYIDPLIIGCYVPEENVKFAINLTIAKEWWVKPFLKIAKTFPIEPNNPMAIKSLIEEVKKDRKIAIFPEGRISTTGSLMKVYEGPGMIADKAKATVLPIRVDGTQFTLFSKTRKVMNGKFRLRRKITITILPPVIVNPPEHLDHRARRKYNGQALYEIMTNMIFESSDYKQTLFQSLISSAKLFGMNSKILQDVDNQTLTYRSLILKSFLIGELISKNNKAKDAVGLMLPNMVGSAVVFFGMQSFGMVPAMINFTSGANNIISSCRTANVRKIYTSRKFIEQAALEDVVKIVGESGIAIIYLENMRKKISLMLKLKAFVASFFPQSYYYYNCASQNDKDPAVILFTSGTEGKPKAVVLSHRNIQANKCQTLAIIDFNPYDLAFNALPLFHSFGLTATMIMLLSGVKVFFYPSPLHYRIIPELIYDIGATIMFGTNSFLTAYAESAHPYDFYSMRYVVSGAEKLKDKTREMWLNKFGIRILEGYGVTETSPVISINTPMYYKAGSVGKLLPKIKYYIKKVDSIKNGGRLCVKGPNIMLGYMKPEKPGIVEKTFTEGLGKGWYDTGDIVDIDSEGYMTILGRIKRFAKIAGEMVSLAAVEELVAKIDDENSHFATIIQDEKKGEQIILFTTNDLIKRGDITKQVREAKLSELYIPKAVIYIKEIPMLSSGKVDHLKMKELAEEKFT